MHQGGWGDTAKRFESSVEQTRVTTWYPHPPSQSCMKYDGASPERSNSVILFLFDYGNVPLMVMARAKQSIANI